MAKAAFDRAENLPHHPATAYPNWFRAWREVGGTCNFLWLKKN
jgi:hypothetical protein